MEKFSFQYSEYKFLISVLDAYLKGTPSRGSVWLFHDLFLA